MEKNSRTILLVEDEIIIALTEKRWLMKEGYKVIHALTGEKAIQIADADPAAIDLILMDIDLGPGIDGTAAAGEILKRHDLPVLFISFHTEAEIVGRAKSVSPYGFVYKGSEDSIKLAAIEVAFRLFDARELLKQRELERKKNEGTIRKFTSIFRNIKRGIVIGHLENRSVEFCNPEFARMHGFKTEEVKGKSFEEFIFPGEAEYIHEKIEILKEKGVINFETVHRRKDGSGFPVQIDMAAICDEKGNKILSVANVMDITKRKEAELKVAEYAEKLKASNAEKEKYISILSHDLKGPVSGFVGLCDVLAHDLDLMTKQEIKEIGEVLYSSSKRIQSLLLNLLEWSRLQRGEAAFESTPFSINNEIDGIIALYSNAAEEKAISVVNNFPERRIIETDKNVFNTVLRNLVSNAIKFTKSYGSVSVSGSFSGTFINISVSDTGVGISAEQMSRIFSIGSARSRRGTNNEEGTGLGLILCHDLVVRFGGEMSIESTPGGGTTVSFSLPAESL